MAYTLTKYERETVITFNEEDAEAEIYTSSPVMIRKLDRLAAGNPEAFRESGSESLEGQTVSKRYRIPKALVSIRSGFRKVSEEQRALSAERLKAARAAREG